MLRVGAGAGFQCHSVSIDCVSPVKVCISGRTLQPKKPVQAEATVKRGSNAPKAAPTVNLKRGNDGQEKPAKKPKK